MPADGRFWWLYVDAVPVVAYAGSHPYTAQQLARRVERLTARPCEIVQEEDDLYTVTVDGVTMYAYTDGILLALAAAGVQV